MRSRRYSGPAELFDGHGQKIADIRLAAMRSSDENDGVLPEWDGERLDGRPAWKGTATAAGVDWAPVVASRKPLTVVVGEHTCQAIASYSIDEELKLEGGPSVPF